MVSQDELHHHHVGEHHRPRPLPRCRRTACRPDHAIAVRRGAGRSIVMRRQGWWRPKPAGSAPPGQRAYLAPHDDAATRSEEHTSELQSLACLVCRLLLEKKKNRNTTLNPDEP